MSDKNKNSNDSKNQSEERINVDEALWDQNTYIGRWKQMAFISDFRTIFVPKKKLYEAKKLCNDYALGNEPEDLKKEDIIYVKKLYDSSFHPDNNELMNLVGRMSFQFPGNAILIMAMMTFYKSTVALLGLQVINQAFTTIVNYTNRSITTDELDESKNNIIAGEAFLCGAAASSMVVYGLKKIFYCRGPLFTRLIPLGGLTIGNMVNFAVIRQKEIINGIPVWIIHEKPFMNSKVAAIKAASECFLTRTLTVAPTMIMIPIVAEYIRTTCFYYRRPWALLPIKLSLCLASYVLFCFGILYFIYRICICLIILWYTHSLLVMIPSALALYPMCNCMRPDLMKICPSEHNEFTEKFKEEEQPNRIYYKKGL